MENSTIGGKNAVIVERDEVQEIPINIHIAIFIDGGKGSQGAANKLRNSFVFKEDEDTDRYIYICDSLGSKENLYTTIEGQASFEINIEDDLPYAVSEAVSRLIKSIDTKLYGLYPYANKAKLYFNIFGADTGCLPAMVLINIIAPGTVDVSSNNDFDPALSDNSTCETIDYFRTCGSSVILDSYTFLDIEKGNEEKKESENKTATEIPTSGYQIKNTNGDITMLTGGVTYKESVHVFEFDSKVTQLKEQIKASADCAKMQVREKYLPYINNGVSLCRKKISDANFSIYTYCTAKDNLSVWTAFKQVYNKIESKNKKTVKTVSNKDKSANTLSQKKVDVKLFNQNQTEVKITNGKVEVKKTNETDGSKLSEHFTLSELCKTDTKLKNTPDADSKVKLKKLCTELLEPIRIKYGYPIIVNSGYRSKEVNIAVKGSDVSQHRYGEAADLSCTHTTKKKLFDTIKEMIENKEITVGQLLWEFGSNIEPAWVHVSLPANSRLDGRKLLNDAEKVDNNGKYTIIPIHIRK